jgi:tetratricopeptide (TPR) repeat protein
MQCAAVLLALVAAFGTAMPAAAQSDPRTALLGRAGWDAVAAGRLDVAAEAFRQAVIADPRNPQLHLGVATVAFMQRRDDDARSALEKALAIVPKLARAESLMGAVLYRAGDLPGAIRVFETLTTETPGDGDARASLDRWRRELELQQRMHQQVGDHFAVSFEGPAEEALAVKAIELLNRAYWRIGDVLNVYPNASVPVVLYTTQQFRDITRSPEWAAGAYDGTIRVPMRGALDDEKELDRVLSHEFAHALVRTLSAAAIPTWLNEGLATVFESNDLEWAEHRVAQSKPVGLDVLAVSFGRFTGGQAQLAYATSALAVRRMLREGGGFAVANLIRDLGAGVEFDRAFTHRMQRPFEDFQATSETAHTQ